MKGMCRDCDQYERCTMLCPKARQYASQDEVPPSYRLEPIDPLHLDFIVNGSPMDPLSNRHRPVDAHGLTCGPVELGLEEWRLVEQAGLTDYQKKCLYLYHWSCLGTSVIGRLMGVTRTTAEKHLHRARAKLKAYLVRGQGNPRLFIQSMESLAEGQPQRRIRRTG